MKMKVEAGALSAQQAETIQHIFLFAVTSIFWMNELKPCLFVFFFFFFIYVKDLAPVSTFLVIIVLERMQ